MTRSGLRVCREKRFSLRNLCVLCASAVNLLSRALTAETRRGRGGLFPESITGLLPQAVLYRVLPLRRLLSIRIIVRQGIGALFGFLIQAGKHLASLLGVRLSIRFGVRASQSEIDFWLVRA